MYILQQKAGNAIGYLKYDGWHIHLGGAPLDLNDCILFTEGEVALNPPSSGEAYQHWGCYTPIGRMK